MEQERYVFSKVSETVGYEFISEGTALEFIRKHQDSWLHAEGSTPSRTRLYQMGIRRFWKEITAQFIVIGLASDGWIPFRKGINYEAFPIRHK